MRVVLRAFRKNFCKLRITSFENLKLFKRKFGFLRLKSVKFADFYVLFVFQEVYHLIWPIKSTSICLLGSKLSWNISVVFLHG